MRFSAESLAKIGCLTEQAVIAYQSGNKGRSRSDRPQVLCDLVERELAASGSDSI